MTQQYNRENTKGGPTVKQSKSALCKLIFSMFIFGTIGVFVRYIPLQSSMIALIRGVVGTISLLVLLLCSGKSISCEAVKMNLLWLCLSGACIGFNWILLFESYRYTTVTVSTLCYYTAPIMVIIASVFIFKQKLTVKSIVCVFAALLGMVFVSGVPTSGISGAGELKGIFYGLGAAALYASVMILNKQFKQIDAYDRTILQLGISAVVLLPYCILTYETPSDAITPTAIILLLIVGIVHTGFSYYFYFASMSQLNLQTIAIISYIDPVVAVIASVVILAEPMKFTDMVGTFLILGAALISELPAKRKERSND